MLPQTRDEIATLGLLESTFEHSCPITDNFAVGIFQYYDIEGLPARLMIWSIADGGGTDS